MIHQHDLVEILVAPDHFWGSLGDPSTIGPEYLCISDPSVKIPPPQPILAGMATWGTNKVGS